MPVEITVPGSKSITNRALILAALSAGETTLKNASICTDSDYLVSCLNKLGIPAEQNGSTITIQGYDGKPPMTENHELYTHNAGTTTRFITALSTIYGQEFTISGDERMNERPILPLVNALNQIGAKITPTGSCPPLLISAQIPQGGEINISGDISSQYISALLLICPFLKKETAINIITPLCSKPYIEITLKLLEKFQLTYHNQNFHEITIPGKQKSQTPGIYTVEPDASSASYPAAYAALHGSTVVLKNINKSSIQGDIAFIEILEKMGCTISENTNNTTITGPKTLQALGEIDMNATPDIVMTFAILAAFAKGKTKITNIGNLRIKETDRLTALENELKKIGANITTTENSITIIGDKELHGNAQIETYNDHRMAMSFALLQDLLPNLEILNPSCVEKSYYSFWDDLKKLQNK